MLAGTEFSPPFPILESGSGFIKEHGGSSTIEDESSDVLGEALKQIKISKPPRHLSGLRHCMSSAVLVASELELDTQRSGVRSCADGDDSSSFIPVVRSGSCSVQGPVKRQMEDEHICIDNLLEHDTALDFPSPRAFYGVFDGHGGLDAATFVRENILKFIVEDVHFPNCVENAIRSAFVNVDHAFSDDHSLDSSSGTTALTALISGRKLLIANAGDCRAVLGRRGKAVVLSKDHKPDCNSELLRIVNLGGFVCDGYLNGQLSVARALGDWHMKGPKGIACPLSAEPELQETILTEEDEFLIMGCDGLWDVVGNQCAVTIVRRELMLHNDPEKCAIALVKEALNWKAWDNLTVIVVCFSPNPPPRLEIPRFRVRRSISAEGLNFLQDALGSNA
ncbi:hypothetical protein C5167_011099 [Papaver somniferum]|uniref:protein-serine/threonine phosphatase n=1 Tax=Papaver somniferum TaxID=3469 RepID=A0A4Y7K3K2_PAPSO|nr:probable protein phosphatase 2C 27 [Papaver somniferum]RZC67406.1 hypothetical protein C5167_011099 [Papaver somniferum]